MLLDTEAKQTIISQRFANQYQLNRITSKVRLVCLADSRTLAVDVDCHLDSLRFFSFVWELLKSLSEEEPPSDGESKQDSKPSMRL